MSAPSEKQLNFIRSLAKERSQFLSETKPAWLVAPTTGAEASALIKTLLASPKDKVVPTDTSLIRGITELRTLLNNLDTRDAGFAVSLISQFDNRGALSDKQLAWVTTLIDKAKNPTAEPPLGIHLSQGEYISVYRTKNGRLAGRRLHIINGKGSFEYESGVVARYKLSDQTVLTSEQASAFGRTHRFCVFCCRDLTDDRSLAVGYGPTCADNHNLPYPSLEEASETLNRPVSV